MISYSASVSGLWGYNTLLHIHPWYIEIYILYSFTDLYQLLNLSRFHLRFTLLCIVPLMSWYWCGMLVLAQNSSK